MGKRRPVEVFAEQVSLRNAASGCGAHTRSHILNEENEPDFVAANEAVGNLIPRITKCDKQEVGCCHGL